MYQTFYVLNTSLSGNAWRVLVTWLEVSSVSPPLADDIRETEETSFLQETSREVGSQARRLAYCLNGLLQKRPENWHDPAKIFGSVRLSKKAWLCHPAVSLGMQCLVLQNNGLSNSGKYSLLTHSHHGQESRLGATAVSTDCTDTAAISRGSWSCDLDWEGESLWTSAWSTLHWACSLKVYNTILKKKTVFLKRLLGCQQCIWATERWTGSLHEENQTQILED